MNLYEGLFLTDAGLASKDWPALEKHIHDILTKQGAEILYTEKWPDRRLAYEVKGCKKGSYYLVYFNAPAEAIGEANREIELSEKILRAMFIQEEGLDTEMEKRKNKELEPPPLDLTLDDRGFRPSGRFRDRPDRPPRRDRPERSERSGDAAKPAESKPAEAKPAEAAPAVAVETAEPPKSSE